METGTPMRGYCYDGWLGFVRAVYKVHALIEGVEKYSNEQSNIYIDELMGDKGERDLLKDTQYSMESDVTISDSLFQVMQLVLEKMGVDMVRKERSTFHGTEVNSVAQKLNYLLYSGNRNTTKEGIGDLLDSVLSGPMHRAQICALFCETILVDSLDISNCFALLELAQRLGSGLLEQCCLDFCLIHFSEAFNQDLDGLASLPYERIQLLLSSDYLQPLSEKQVLAAICTWVEADLSNRINLFTYLFATCIRFSQLTYTELSEIIDTCDLIAMNHSAIELAAHELIQKTMGTERDNALGLGTINRPRHSKIIREESHERHYLKDLMSTLVGGTKSSRKHLALLNQAVPISTSKKHEHVGGIDKENQFLTSTEMLLSPNRPMSAINYASGALSRSPRVLPRRNLQWHQ